MREKRVGNGKEKAKFDLMLRCYFSGVKEQ